MLKGKSSCNISLTAFVLSTLVACRYVLDVDKRIMPDTSTLPSHITPIGSKTPVCPYRSGSPQLAFCESNRLKVQEEYAEYLQARAKSTCGSGYQVQAKWFAARSNSEFQTTHLNDEPDVWMSANQSICTSPQDMHGRSWTFWKVGPFITSGGYDWTELVRFYLSGFPSVTTVDGFAIIPLDAGDATIPEERLHFHHVHLQSKSTQVYTYGVHTDATCDVERGGEACLVQNFPLGYGYAVYKPFVHGGFNDNRRKQSRARSLYIEFAMRWRSGLLPRNFVYMRVLTWTNDFIGNGISVPSNQYSACWAAYTIDMPGTLMWASTHTHGISFGGFWVYRNKTASELGLDVAPFLMRNHLEWDINVDRSEIFPATIHHILYPYDSARREDSGRQVDTLKSNVIRHGGAPQCVSEPGRHKGDIAFRSEIFCEDMVFRSGEPIVVLSFFRPWDVHSATMGFRHVHNYVRFYVKEPNSLRALKIPDELKFGNSLACHQSYPDFLCGDAFFRTHKFVVPP